MSSLSKVQLYCAWFCPFAQRAWIALNEKQVDYEYIETDPYNKTPEFLSVCPRGLVPSVVHNGKPIYESIVLVEYIDEVWKKEVNLLPDDPYDRAMAKIWVDFISKKIVPVFYAILQKQDKAGQETAKEAFMKNLETLTGAMSKQGPYFFGANFGFVDIMLVPYTFRLRLLAHYRGLEVPTNGVFERLQTWMKAAHSRESVKSTLPEWERLVAVYQRYADNTAKTEVAEAIRAGTALP
ncbi:probable glutathione S-transferase [Aplysia californica]|uniref:Glutathione S-transferase omega n=1 Tax=Aplysia californica TaxID=6500 RepID=A0ABM0JKD0_APLCA|nr:probable glutathione S-transferase [Aplysia californica]